MKKEIHPKYVDGKVKCACGAQYDVLTMAEQTSIDICSHCHPFFTGKQKLVDTAGRIEQQRPLYRSGCP